MEVEICGDDYPIIEVKGEIDHFHAPKLEAHIREAIAVNPNKHLVIDIIDVNYIDSAGVGVLFAVVDEMKKSSPGKNIFTIYQDVNVKRILDLVGIESISNFVLTAQKEEAMRKAGDSTTNGS